MVKITKKLHFINRDDWRLWLEENHAAQKEIWLVFYKKHTGKPSLSYDDAVEEALCFGWIDGIMKRIDDEKHAIRYSPRKNNSVWSKSNKKSVERMIKQGRMTEAGLAKVRAAKQSGEWQNATIREDLIEIPDDLIKALAANDSARKNFYHLAPSYKKQFIYWIMDAKREETRRKRIEEIVRLAQENKKPGMK
ncbi:YdeI family protein [Chloroflexota bacterium]